MDDAGFIKAAEAAAHPAQRLRASHGRRNLAAVVIALAVHAGLISILAFRMSQPPTYEAYEEPAFTLTLAPQPKPPVPETPREQPKTRQVSRPEPPPFTPREVVAPPNLPIPPLAVRPPPPPEPAPPQPAAEAPPTAAPASASGRATFQSLVLSRIERARRYPPAARARREEGIATVAFTMSRGGKVSAVSIQSSTGSSLLDREAMETVRRAQPLPPVPEDIEAPLRLVVRLEFFVK